MMTPEQIQTMIEQAMPGSEVAVQDLTGTQDHFQVLVISDSFEGKNMVEQHQMVYRALGDSMKQAIHALALKTYTPQQWKQQ
jgi:stress-induced morphogen